MFNHFHQLILKFNILKAPVQYHIFVAHLVHLKKILNLALILNILAVMYMDTLTQVQAQMWTVEQS